MANNPSRLYKEVWIGLGGTQSAVYRYSRKPGTDLWTEAGTASESDDTRIAFPDDDALSALMTA